ncbi:DUF3169 family protein [Clostridium sp. Sa3CUN1]|uniref:DUF3169 family protein n=1 Tax=Clostridium gallinarum TaxID=2762246 RepID=A0ABR8Q3S3_9CLOT|nr:DUF3169 family protein [Clostridium gallinarum]MBD7915079.1 DUF3169 family protein [Clostridium gallinarum]
MSNTNINEIKKEDKKAFKGFIILIIIALIAGFFTGFISGNLKEILGESVPILLISILEKITPFVSIVLSLIIIIISKIIYANTRKKYDLFKKSNDNEDIVDKIEGNLSILLLITSINTIVGFFFFGVASVLSTFYSRSGDISIIRVFCSFIGFILCLISSILIQKNVINLEKEINPLLKGSIYDINFSKKWVESCDEAIKLGIFKSAYKAYKCVSITCIILWIFCVIGHDLWNFGVMPMVMVTIIWLVQTISYSIESIKRK